MSSPTTQQHSASALPGSFLSSLLTKREPPQKHLRPKSSHTVSAATVVSSSYRSNFCTLDLASLKKHNNLVGRKKQSLTTNPKKSNDKQKEQETKERDKDDETDDESVLSASTMTSSLFYNTLYNLGSFDHEDDDDDDDNDSFCALLNISPKEDTPKHDATPTPTPATKPSAKPRNKPRRPRRTSPGDDHPLQSSPCATAKYEPPQQEEWLEPHPMPIPSKSEALSTTTRVQSLKSSSPQIVVRLSPPPQQPTRKKNVKEQLETDSLRPPPSSVHIPPTTAATVVPKRHQRLAYIKNKQKRSASTNKKKDVSWSDKKSDPIPAATATKTSRRETKSHDTLPTTAATTSRWTVRRALTPKRVGLGSDTIPKSPGATQQQQKHTHRYNMKVRYSAPDLTARRYRSGIAASPSSSSSSSSSTSTSSKQKKPSIRQSLPLSKPQQHEQQDDSKSLGPILRSSRRFLQETQRQTESNTQNHKSKLQTRASSVPRHAAWPRPLVATTSDNSNDDDEEANQSSSLQHLQQRACSVATKYRALRHQKRFVGGGGDRTTIPTRRADARPQTEDMLLEPHKEQEQQEEERETRQDFVGQQQEEHRNAISDTNDVNGPVSARSKQNEEARADVETNDKVSKSVAQPKDAAVDKQTENDHDETTAPTPSEEQREPPEERDVTSTGKTSKTTNQLESREEVRDDVNDKDEDDNKDDEKDEEGNKKAKKDEDHDEELSLTSLSELLKETMKNHNQSTDITTATKKDKKAAVNQRRKFRSVVPVRVFLTSSEEYVDEFDSFSTPSDMESVCYEAMYNTATTRSKPNPKNQNNKERPSPMTPPKSKPRKILL